MRLETWIIGVIAVFIKQCAAQAMMEELTEPEAFMLELERCEAQFQESPDFHSRFLGFSKPVEMKKVVERFNAGKEIYKVFPLVGTKIRIELVSIKQEGFGDNKNFTYLYQVCFLLNDKNFWQTLQNFKYFWHFKKTNDQTSWKRFCLLRNVVDGIFACKYYWRLLLSFR